MRITIVYDNRARPGLKSDWGFSCLVEAEERILFDTGPTGEELVFNMKRLNIDARSIDKIVISHNHWDHTGGLETLVKMNGKAQVFEPDSFSEITELSPGVRSTGPLGASVVEQSLVVSTQKGNVVVTGCAHPGLENILEQASRLGRIYGVIGGMHLRNASKGRIKDIIAVFRRYDVQMVGPAHCTGDNAIEEFEKAFSGRCLTCSAGMRIDL
ncbi:MAG: MBL fold metallo-hydrolase [Sedimentisphaerales bacterium]|nr:MBL fold metallo-hydrolase [Sedimentisphaerales bacterium]